MLPSNPNPTLLSLDIDTHTFAAGALTSLKCGDPCSAGASCFASLFSWMLELVEASTGLPWFHRDTSIAGALFLRRLLLAFSNKQLRDSRTAMAAPTAPD